LEDLPFALLREEVDTEVLGAGVAVAGVLLVVDELVDGVDVAVVIHPVAFSRRQRRAVGRRDLVGEHLFGARGVRRVVRGVGDAGVAALDHVPGARERELVVLRDVVLENRGVAADGVGGVDDVAVVAVATTTGGDEEGHHESDPEGENQRVAGRREHGAPPSALLLPRIGI